LLSFGLCFCQRLLPFGFRFGFCLRQFPGVFLFCLG
jgi:hypothetical protein